MSVSLVVATVVAVVLAGLVSAVGWLVGAVRRLEKERDDLGPGVAPLPADVRGLRQEVAALRAESADALRHLAVVRYDAFGDMGGHLSWSVALLDDAGHGVVLTSIHGRAESRTYAKNITSWRCEQQLSPEEDEAVGHAKAAA